MKFAKRDLSSFLTVFGLVMQTEPYCKDLRFSITAHGQ